MQKGRQEVSVDRATKRRVTQTHMDAIAKDSGPIYGVRLIRDLPIGGMLQAMPSREDLELVRKYSERTVAGYEVLLQHYRNQTDEVSRLTGLIRNVIAGKWSLTDLQEAIGDI